MSNKHLTETSFTEFNLPSALLQGLGDAGFHYCTPIQAKTLPIVLAGNDVAGQAQTGTGKTAVFLLAAMHRLLTCREQPDRQPNQPRVLVLSPTRELAIQIHRDAIQLGRYTGLSMGLVYGGVGYESQRRMLEEGVDVLVGTPGRLIDYFKQRVYNLKAIDVAIIDEADRMFDLGFIKDIRFLLRRMPKPEIRQSMLFSATLSYRVMELAYEHMNNPTTIRIEPDKVTVDLVTQKVYCPSNEEKIPLLIGLLKHMDPTRSLIFVNTKYAADTVWRYLEGNSIEAAVLSGDVPQPKRQSLLKRFTQGELPVLVATDVAARGLHIPDVSHVFNFDLPQDAEDYVHRIGRTARAGASGDAVSFACEEFAFSLSEIESYIGHKIPLEPVTNDLLVELNPPIKAKPRRHGPRKHAGGQQKKQNSRGRRRGSRNPIPAGN